MHLSQAVLLAGALTGVSAHPSRHAHLHREVHERNVKVEVHTKYLTQTQWVDMPAPTHVHVQAAPSSSSSSSATTTSTTQAAAKPTTASSAAAKSSSAASTGSSSSGAGGFGCSASAKSKKRATEAQIMYTGNLGTSDGCPWGSNIKTISAGDVNSYDYTVTVKNTASEDMFCIASNKMGFDKKLDGSWKLIDVPEQVPLTFTVGAGQTGYVAIDKNTQGQIMCGPNECVTTTWGQYACTWLEFDMGNTSNDNCSGADISSLVYQSASLTSGFIGAKVDTVGGVDKPSWICSGASSGHNAYTAGTEKEDGLGFSLPAGKAQLVFTLGYC